MSKPTSNERVIEDHNVEFHIGAEVSARMTEHCPEHVSEEVRKAVHDSYKREANERLFGFAQRVQEIRANEDDLDSVGMLLETIAAVSDFFYYSQPELSNALNRATMDINKLEEERSLKIATEKDEYTSVGNSPISLSIEFITKSLKMTQVEEAQNSDDIIYKSELIPGITLVETTDEAGRVSLIAKLADDYKISEQTF